MIVALMKHLPGTGKKGELAGKITIVLIHKSLFFVCHSGLD